MYIDEKLLFHGLFIKILFENLKKKIPPHPSQNGYPEEKTISAGKDTDERGRNSHPL
jgi:hypothetical protein